MSAHPSRVSGARPRDRRHAASRSSLKVVRRNQRGLIQRKASRRVTPLAVIAGLLVAATIFGVLLEQVVLAQTGFKMAELRDEMATAENENAKLVLKAAKLSSSDRIKKVATGQLGMVKPHEVDYIVANVRGPRNRLLAQQQSQALSPGSGTAAAELGGLAP